MRAVQLTVVVMLLLQQTALAAYSAPLMRVRIDADTRTHTPSLAYASSLAFSTETELDLRFSGAQYIFEQEWKSGWGVQLGLALGWAHVTTEQPGLAGGDRLQATGNGLFLGGQLRVYKMLWSGFFGSTGKVGQDRPHAVTAFVNFRGIYYNASGDFESGSAPSGDFSGSFGAIGMGVGVMAEFVPSNYVSILPYAWFSPALWKRNGYTFDSTERIVTGGPSVRQPIRVGIDVWFYPEGARSEDHIALSAIASLIDTEDKGNQEFSLVLGYTF